jgi:3-dehydroquinate dehydratase/shikimate dehydrogenase
MLAELREAEQAGAQVVELRLDFLSGFSAERDLPALLSAARLPLVVTFRPAWEGGQFAGAEEERLAALWVAVREGAAFVDVELKAAARFWALAPPDWLRSDKTRFIVSSHNYSETPSCEALSRLHAEALSAGADVVKIATTCKAITDVARLEALLASQRGTPTIALGMGEAGLVRFPSHTFFPRRLNECPL